MLKGQLDKKRIIKKIMSISNAVYLKTTRAHLKGHCYQAEIHHKAALMVFYPSSGLGIRWSKSILLWHLWLN